MLTASVASKKGIDVNVNCSTSARVIHAEVVAVQLERVAADKFISSSMAVDIQNPMRRRAAGLADCTGVGRFKAVAFEEVGKLPIWVVAVIVKPFGKREDGGRRPTAE